MRSSYPHDKYRSPLSLSARSNGLLFSSKCQYPSGSTTNLPRIKPSPLSITMTCNSGKSTKDDSRPSNSPSLSAESSKLVLSPRSSSLLSDPASAVSTPTPDSASKKLIKDINYRFDDLRINDLVHYKYRSLFAPPPKRDSLFSFSSRHSSLTSIHSSRSIISVRTRFLLRYDSFAKSKNLAHLPSEIIGQILQYLDQASLVNIIHVSPALYDLGIQHLYYSPEFSSSYRFAQFVDTVSHNSALANLVHVLNLSHIRPGQEIDDESLYSFGNTLDQTGQATGLAGWRDWKYRSLPFYSPVDSDPLATTHNVVSTVVKRESKAQMIKTQTTTPTTPTTLTTTVTSSRRKKTKKWIKGFSKRRHERKLNDLLFVSIYNDHFPSNRPQSSYSPFYLEREVDRRSSRSFRRSSKHQKSPQTNSSQKNSFRKNSPQTNLSKTTTLKTPSRISSRYASHGNGPFSTPHPLQSLLLSKYANSKDIPVGYVLHILRVCENLILVDLSDLTLAEDYQINKKTKAPKTTTTTTTTTTMKNSESLLKWLYLSDTPHLSPTSLPSASVRRIGPPDIIHHLSQLPHLRSLILRHCLWLTKPLVKEFVVHSKSIKPAAESGEVVAAGGTSGCQLSWMDFEDSGMMKNLDWATGGTIEDFQIMFDLATKITVESDEEDYEFDSDEEVFFQNF